MEQGKTMEAPAPGARVLIRDEEWLVRGANQCDLGGYELECLGVSETVRHREAHWQMLNRLTSCDYGKHG